MNTGVWTSQNISGPPWAISLAYGVVFATFITVVMTPGGYRILEDISRFFCRIGRRKPIEEQELEKTAGYKTL
jgi:hypothetical protein